MVRPVQSGVVTPPLGLDPYVHMWNHGGMAAHATMKRLSMYLHPRLHERLKIAAAKRGISMTELVVEMLTEGLDRR